MMLDFLKKKGTWSILIGVVGILGTMYTIFDNPKRGLEFIIEKRANLFDKKDDGVVLKVFLNDTTDLSKLNKEISIYEVLVSNQGGENVRIDDFDSSLNFGLLIKGGEILKTPKIIESSDVDYYKDVLEAFTNNELVFKKKIIDSENYFKVKFFVLHGQDEVPVIKSVGRISGQGIIPILDRSITDEELSAQKDERINLVFISLIFTLLGFSGLVYAYLQSLKNQKLIAEQKYIIENSTIEREVLLKEIDKLRKNIK